MAGKVLRVKLGYNPNSSSIGSLFSAFLWVAASGSFLMAAFSQLRPGDDAGAKHGETKEEA